MNKRKAVEEFITKYINKLLPGSHSVKVYKELFANMDDTAFTKFINDLAEDKINLVLYAPGFSKNKLSLERNFALAKELNYNFFQKLWIGKKNDIPEHLTPVKYMVVDLPLRRVSQLLSKKIKIPEHNRTVDVMTGQPTSDSKGARLSFEEIKIMAAMGLDNCILELIKYRGGDLKGFNAMNAMIGRYGSANLKTLANFSSGVESTKTFSTFLKAMHYKTTL